jgi:hypothetical protein
MLQLQKWIHRHRRINEPWDCSQVHKVVLKAEAEILILSWRIKSNFLSTFQSRPKYQTSPNYLQLNNKTDKHLWMKASGVSRHERGPRKKMCDGPPYTFLNFILRNNFLQLPCICSIYFFPVVNYPLNTFTRYFRHVSCYCSYINNSRCACAASETHNWSNAVLYSFLQFKV